ncbi:ATP-binding cassette sub-family C member 5-like isoform X3 [Prorops nasuta]|uniref:ATP-binding cassette sub-family C member 5-like isoform X3 n=1 Tax=Prorops nasuta TaxID=863751 RepID=UPI0034CD9F34
MDGEGKSQESDSRNGQLNQNERLTDDTSTQHFLLPNADARTPNHILQYNIHKKASRYNNALKNAIPYRYDKVTENSMPIDSAGLVSYITVNWLTKYILKAYKQDITVKDLPLISPYDTCNYNVQRLELLWKEEQERNGFEKASFTKAAWKFVQTRVFLTFTFLTCSVTLGFISPTILMRKILEHLESSDTTIWDGMQLAILLTLCDSLKMFFFNLAWLTNLRTALRLKSACMTLIYKKLLGLNNPGNHNIGEVINLFSVDSQRLYDAVIFTPMIISGPIVAVCSVVYILWLFNPIALLGMTIFLLFYVFQYYISRGIGHFRQTAVTIADIRVKLTNEVADCIRLIKIYSWEKFFQQSILSIRAKEEKLLHKTAFLQSISMSLAPTVPVISSIVTFLAHLSQGGSLTAAQVFPIVSLFQAQIRNSFMYVQVALLSLANARIVFTRMKKLLSLEEIKNPLTKPVVKSQIIAIINGCFSYNVRDETDADLDITIPLKYDHSNQDKSLNDSSSKNIAFTLHDITFEGFKGKLTGICGHVGSGKSSLLLAALGQMRMLKGRLMRDGTCAYVSQQAWIVNATFKENILFGEQFDATRYYQALTVCCLKEDINMLPAGDETEIGERGINLSGGQKQRVALARALYANREIYFLDDSLSSVDVHVAAYIFEHLIIGVLKNKTVLLVTHQIQFLKRCDYIYMMQSGTIIEHGTHDDLMELNKEYVQFVSADIPQANKLSQLEKVPRVIDELNARKEISMTENNTWLNDKSKVFQNKGGKLIAEEHFERGVVKPNTYLSYIQSAGGYFVAVLVFLAFFLNIGTSAFSTWWLAIWLKAGGGNVTNSEMNGIISNNISDNPNFNFYKNIYSACIGAIVLTSLVRGLAIMIPTIRASSNLHKKIFGKLIDAPLEFFETTPIGRIQNIFSRDLNEVDCYLPISIEHVIQYIFLCSFAIIFICSVLPWFCIFLIILAGLFYFISRLYRKAVRDFKRIDSMSRSPILSFVTTTLQGLNTIHAFNKEKEFIKKFEELNDTSSLCHNITDTAARWLSLRLDSLAAATTCICAFLVVFLKGDISPALAGLALTYCAQISGVFQFTVRVMSEAETRFINVERIIYYINTLKKEGSSTSNPIIKTDEKWPAKGEIKFSSVSMRHRKELPLVLHDISFTVKSGEKIGIVGRTGAGKSSLLAVLFRLVEISDGSIKIDDIDISTIDLETLRSKLSIIPQDPVIFSGTIRSNLDPFNMCTDEQIWSAIEKTQLKERISLMPGKLNESVDSSDSTLSIGERQLFCLTRALLRNNKIIVLDEATAAVDPETEILVQNTIKKEFIDCTVLTIAHRLQTVSDSDRILVMSKGRVVEFDKPSVLLSNPDSAFSKMTNPSDNVHVK